MNTKDYENLVLERNKLNKKIMEFESIRVEIDHISNMLAGLDSDNVSRIVLDNGNNIYINDIHAPIIKEGIVKELKKERDKLKEDMDNMSIN